MFWHLFIPEGHYQGHYGFFRNRQNAEKARAYYAKKNNISENEFLIYDRYFEDKSWEVEEDV